MYYARALFVVILVACIAVMSCSSETQPQPLIAFESERDGNREIYTMRPDGTKQIRLTKSPTYDGSPVWSPDGKKIAFESERDGNREIYIMNPDGTNQTWLTDDSAYDGFPAWRLGVIIKEQED